MKKKKNKKNKKPRHNEEGNGRKITKHHILSRSRGGGERLNNTVKIPERYHVAWHVFFGNLTPKEAIQFIRIIFSRKGKKHGSWTIEDLYNLQLGIQKRNNLEDDF